MRAVSFFYQPLLLGTANHAPQKTGVTPISKTEAVSQPLPAFPGGLLKVYFGKDLPTSDVANPPLEALARKAVDWLDQNVEPIPSLERNNRKNHRVHLRLMGDVLGLMPLANSASEAYRQYVAIFNALETKVASNKKDYRMYCHDKNQTAASSNDYIVRHYGFYILVFAPNGAIESFRRNTPPVVDIDGQNKTDNGLRMKFFKATGSDFNQLQALLKINNHRLPEVPVFLSDTNTYTRSVFKLGANGQDAWQQVYPFTAESAQRKKDFEAWSQEIDR